MTEPGGKAALVTGGGSGIGRALAKALAAEGASVVVADILPENAQQVASEITRAGGSALAVACDVSDRASVRDMKGQANAAFGPISLLFANAGVTSVERLTDLSPDEVRCVAVLGDEAPAPWRGQVDQVFFRGRTPHRVGSLLPAQPLAASGAVS